MDRKFITHRFWVLSLRIMRHSASALLMAFLLIAMSLASVPILGQAQAPEEEMLYEENFDDDQAQGWELEQGWVVDDGRLNGSEHALARYMEGNWGDGRVTFKFSLVYLKGDVRANFRMSEAGSYAIGFRYTEQCLARELLYIQLLKQTGPDEVYSTLAEGTIYYDELCKNVEIVTEGGNIQVYVQETAPEFQPYLYNIFQKVQPVAAQPGPVIDYVDPAPLPPGTIAFETLEGSTAQIDDIVVTGPQVPPQPPPPPVHPQPELGRPPDLTIFSLDYRFENNGRILVFPIGINNQGYVRTPETSVDIWEQNHEFPDRTSPVPGVSPGEAITLEIRQEVPDEQRGTTHTFLFEVDPRGDIPELNEENNRKTVDILIPAPGGGMPWYWVGVVLLAGGAGYFIKRWSDRRQPKIPKQIQIRPQKDIGSQQIESPPHLRLNYEISFRPVSDPGKQYIEVKGSLIIDKRRQR
jgi:hypothetical protein